MPSLAYFEDVTDGHGAAIARKGLFEAARKVQSER